MDKKEQAKQLLEATYVWMAKHPVYVLLAPLAFVGRSNMFYKDDPFSPLQGHIAATNGYDKFYEVEAFLGLDREERRFLVLHEVSHQARMHDTLYDRLKQEDHVRLNHAMDYSINADLKADTTNLKMPPNGLYNKKYDGWPIHKIYRDLEGKVSKSMDLHMEYGISAEQMAQIERALSQGRALSAKMQSASGSGGGSMTICEERGTRDWSRYLLESIIDTIQGDGGDTSWAHPRRRWLADDLYLPSDVQEVTKDIVFVLDVSGSCFSESEQKQFIAELKAALYVSRAQRIIVLQVDTEVVRSDIYTPNELPKSFDVSGGGGTDLEVAYDWTTENKIDVGTCIFLTDGYTPYDKPPKFPVIWCVSDTSISPSYGKTLYIS